MLKRPALGQSASLGRLYDARNDTFLPLSVLRKSLPAHAIIKTDTPSSEIKYCRTDSFKDKFNQLDISPDLGASFLAGFFTVDGSGRYLYSQRESELTVHASLVYNVTTVNEMINLQISGPDDCFAFDVLDSEFATHVVAEIHWGSRNIVTLKHSVRRQQDLNQVSSQLDSQIALLGTKLSGTGDFEKASFTNDFENAFKVSIFGDINANDGNVPTDLAGASHFLKNVPAFIATSNAGKGKPLTYTMLPICELSKILKCQILREISIKKLNMDCLETFVSIFDEITLARRTLCDYLTFLQENRSYVSQDDIRAMRDRLVKLTTRETRLQSSYATALHDVRAGKAPQSSLWDIIETHKREEMAIYHLSGIGLRHQREKISLVKRLVDNGADYIGFNDESLDLALGSVRDVDVYVLYISNAARGRDDSWTQNISLAHHLLDNQDAQARLILKDCDAFGEPLSKTRISHFRNAEEVIANVLEDRKASLATPVAQYTRSFLDRSGAPKPVSRIPVKMPCPGPSCAINVCYEWVCSKCKCQLEYGHVDQYIYCDCGRCNYRYWAFKCPSKNHGFAFNVFDNSRLLNILGDLEPFEELNILILGRTGVGKSTWINAFTNYLMFPTLDDALDENQKLRWVIPFAFKTYTANTNGEFEYVKVKVGFSEQANGSEGQKVGVDENDGTTGISATQKTAVHRVKIGSRLIRLIDTPGIGDTRGASQDKENMADILSVLRTYNNLHGIIILLKPNEQKLDVTFRFCIKELLTHLHRDAAQNIAFGFTNTRGTNYSPGDTFDPLMKLLKEFKEAQIVLRTHNVYCFDSESFRYLAAQKQHNQELGHFDENRASWAYSVNESRRLIDYFQGLPPHKVRSTVNLYETRHRIIRLTEPMAAIAESIRSTISLNEDDIEELSHNETKKRDLETLLKVQVKTLTAVKAKYPTTTCHDPSCIEHLSTGITGLDGNSVINTRFKTACHKKCYLTGVEPDQVNNHRIKGCWAMNGTHTCRICGHPWNVHLHILYKVQEGIEEINDPEIEEALQRNADIRTKREAAISAKKRLIHDLELELKKIGDAAAQFSVFLRRNAIIPYNDATIEYLDRNMEDEKRKVFKGGSRDKLDSLTQYRQQYEQQVRILDEYMEKGEHQMLLDQKGVENTLRDLHDLKHSGKILRNMGQIIQSAESVVHREKPVITMAQQHWENTSTPKCAAKLGPEAPTNIRGPSKISKWIPDFSSWVRLPKWAR